MNHYMNQPMLRPTLVLATIIYALALLPAVILAPFAVFLFDDRTADALTYIFATLWFTLPATLILSILGGWFTHTRSKAKAMSVFLLLPIGHAVLIVISGILQFAR